MRAVSLTLTNVAMNPVRASADEVVYSNSNLQKEKAFAAIVVALFFLVVLVAPVYFGDEMNWFGYGTFIVASIGTSSAVGVAWPNANFD